MAKKTWIGGAAAIAQVDTLTVGGTIEAGDKFKLTLTDERGTTHLLSVSATTTVVATTCTDITTAWNASRDLAFSRITAVAASTTVTLTADTAGRPFTLTITTTESDDGAADAQTFTQVHTTTNSGPNSFNCPGNWAESAAPAAGEDVELTGSSDILYGLQQGSNVTAAFATAGCTGAVGSFEDGPLVLAPTSFKWDGTGQAFIDVGSANIPLTIHNTASASTGHGLYIKGSNLTTVTITKGDVGIAVLADETATMETVEQGWDSSQDSDSNVTIGSGVTLTTYHKTGGVGLLNCAATTVGNDHGNLTTQGSGAITTLNVANGTVVLNSSGTITTANLNGGTTDLMQNDTARTVTTCKLNAGATLKYDPAVVTMTNKVNSDRAVVLTATVP